ncbi:MAG: hypothetical protein Q7S45_00540 [Candidatus Curtissbacteria bacterium]|nr:hypothetical protein [Candidatus Curtissbacteria bacterium]
MNRNQRIIQAARRRAQLLPFLSAEGQRMEIEASEGESILKEEPLKKIPGTKANFEALIISGERGE